MATKSINGHSWASAVLAAGKGSRMGTQTPKPLHLLVGQPLIQYPMQAVKDAGFGEPLVVCDASPALPDSLGADLSYVVQERPDGTGGALRAIMDVLEPDVHSLLVINGDSPLISSGSLLRLTEVHAERQAVVSLLIAETAPTSGLARVLQDADGEVVKILELSDSDYSRTPETLVNAGAYCFDVAWLRDRIRALPVHENGELYLTDLVAVARSENRAVRHLIVEDSWEAMGVNTLVDLASAEQEVRRRVLKSFMLSGVIILDPATTYIETEVSIGPDTVIRPNTHINGYTTIGQGCDIGPGSQIADSVIGDGCRIWSSALEEATLEENVTVGPYSHLRPGAYLSRDVHIGNFGEVKESRLGRGVAMGHFGYVGVAQIGDDVNIGAGTVTCNFDGVNKHRTIVEDGVFIGSDTMLVAPVRVGARARTAAGTVVTKDVAADARVAGVPARPMPRDTRI